MMTKKDEIELVIARRTTMLKDVHLSSDMNTMPLNKHQFIELLKISI